MTSDATRAGLALTDPGRRPTVGDVMRPPTTTVERQAHLAAAAYLMKRSGDTALVVISSDDDRRPVAIITDADISQAVADGKDLENTRITNIAVREPVTLERDAGIDQAIHLMLSMGIHHVPVVDGGRLVGIVDMADVCRAALGPGEPESRR